MSTVCREMLSRTHIWTWPVFQKLSLCSATLGNCSCLLHSMPCLVHTVTYHFLDHIFGCHACDVHSFVRFQWGGFHFLPECYASEPETADTTAKAQHPRQANNEGHMSCQHCLSYLLHTNSSKVIAGCISSISASNSFCSTCKAHVRTKGPMYRNKSPR